MSTPRDPRGDDVERRLRDSLARHADRAPAPDLLAERIIHAAGRPRAGRQHRRIGWTTPLAAAAVLIVLVGVVLAVTRLGSSDSPNRVADSTGPTVSSSSSPTATPSLQPTQRSTPPPTRTSTGSRTVTAPPPLTGIRIVDLTFNATDSGWALATADCLDGSGKVCPALLHTSDGTSWQSRGNFNFNVPGVSAGCTTDCVEHIRFADDDTGYAFGPKAFFMTTDGGQTWSRQSGGALALETYDGNVVRVTSSGDGCPGPCDIGVQTAPIGSTRFTTRDLGNAPGGSTTGVVLVRGGSDVYLLVTANPAGGANVETSTLYRSSDDGDSWRSSGEPCPQSGGSEGEVDSYALAAAGDGRVTALCGTRLQPTRWSVATSGDHGVSFDAGRGTVPAATARLLTGDPDTVLLTGGTGLARSTDGGRSWSRVGDVTGTVGFVGFESDTVARAITDNGRVIWTTRDGGRTWTSSRLG